MTFATQPEEETLEDSARTALRGLAERLSGSRAYSPAPTAAGGERGPYLRWG